MNSAILTPAYIRPVADIPIEPERAISPTLVQDAGFPPNAHLVSTALNHITTVAAPVRDPALALLISHNFLQCCVWCHQRCCRWRALSSSLLRCLRRGLSALACLSCSSQIRPGRRQQHQDTLDREMSRTIYKPTSNRWANLNEFGRNSSRAAWRL